METSENDTKMLKYIKNFDLNYKILTILGLWSLNTKNPIKKFLYFFYRLISFTFFSIILILFLLNLFINEIDEKIIFNILMTSVTITCFLKSLRGLQKYEKIQNLRKDLNDCVKYETDEDFKKILKKSLGGNEIFFTFYFTVWFGVILSCCCWYLLLIRKRKNYHSACGFRLIV